MQSSTSAFCSRAGRVVCAHNLQQRNPIVEEIAAQKSMQKDQKAKADEAFTKRGMASVVASEIG